MLRNQTVAVIGGDLRQAHLAGLLAGDGFEVAAVGFDRDVELSDRVIKMQSPKDAISRAGCVILPLPYSVDGLTVNAPYAKAPVPLGVVWDSARPGTLIAGGKMPEAAGTVKAGVRLVDYYKREELEILNTIPTAEGAIQIAMEELPITIHNSKAMVTGFGRVSKTLCHDLQALGAKVSVCIRKYSDLAWIRALGYGGMRLTELPERISGFDVIFNTVPAVILSEDILSAVRKDALLIDLASKPGGVDFETASKLGIKTIWALSLPGKVAPITSGAIIKETISNMIKEEETL